MKRLLYSALLIPVFAAWAFAVTITIPDASLWTDRDSGIANALSPEEGNVIGLGLATLPTWDKLRAIYYMEGNSNDSKNGFDGTDTSITYTTGKIGQGAEFNAGTDVISLGTNVSDGIRGFAVWFNSDVLLDSGLIEPVTIERRIGDVDEGLYFDVAGQLIYNNFDATGAVIVSNATSFAASTWYFVVAQTDAINGMEMYIGKVGTDANPVKQADTNVATNAHSTGTGITQIGKWDIRTDRTWDGIIDEFAFLESGLTVAEINEAYNAGAAMRITEFANNSPIANSPAFSTDYTNYNGVTYTTDCGANADVDFGFYNGTAFDNWYETPALLSNAINAAGITNTVADFAHQIRIESDGVNNCIVYLPDVSQEVSGLDTGQDVIFGM